MSEDKEDEFFNMFERGLRLDLTNEDTTQRLVHLCYTQGTELVELRKEQP